ncbi:Heterokaryon incompatibility protein (HET) domain containing protein [Rhypophila decipiens]
MRLINTRTLKVERFLGRVPPYAILSHTWGKEEVTLQDFGSDALRERMKGFGKIQAASQEAQRHDLSHLWVDTCCIDKTSSAELGEAINSMYRWYQSSEVCFTYLEDVSPAKPDTRNRPSIPRPLDATFARSRWFTRGWTLQELVAPAKLKFYDAGWNKIEEKSNITAQLQAITGIDEAVLQGASPEEVSVGRRMSWAASRQTTRQEDIAYCLFGLFHVNLPLIYGEGQRAFLRLQEEILKVTDDHTLFAWRGDPDDDTRHGASGLLAPSPVQFRNFGDPSGILTRPALDRRQWSGVEPRDNLIRVWDPNLPTNPNTLMSKGIRMTCRVNDLRPMWAKGEFLILVLNCMVGGNPARAAGIYLRRVDKDRYARVRVDELASLAPHGRHISVQTLYGVPWTAGVPEIRYREPWTTSYKLRWKLADEAQLEGQRRRTEADRYTGAFYLERGFLGGPDSILEASTIFETYLLIGVFISESANQPRFFQLSPQDIEPDLVLPARPGFAAVLVMESGDGSDLLLVCLTSKSQHGPSEEQRIDTCYLPKHRLEQSQTTISEKMHEMRNTTHPPQWQKTIPVSDGLLQMTVRLSPVEIEGLHMQSVSFVGPYPIAWTRLPRKFVMNFLTTLAAFLVSMVTASVVIAAGLESGFTMEVGPWYPWYRGGTDGPLGSEAQDSGEEGTASDRQDSPDEGVEAQDGEEEGAASGREDSPDEGGKPSTLQDGGKVEEEVECLKEKEAAEITSLVNGRNKG